MERVSGCTKDCLDHLKSMIQRDNDVYQRLRRPLLEFFACGEVAVRWFKYEGCNPGGINLIKVRYFLEALGYGVSELSALNRVVYDLGRIISFGAVTVDDVIVHLDIKKRATFFDNLNAKATPLGDKLQKMQAIVEEYYDFVPQQIERFQIPRLFAEAELSSLPFQDSSIVVLRLAELINEACPLAELLLSDAYDAEARKKLRSLTGDDGVFILKNHLARLMSEKSREMIDVFDRSHKG